MYRKGVWKSYIFRLLTKGNKITYKVTKCFIHVSIRSRSYPRDWIVTEKYTLFICHLKKGFLIDSTQPFNYSLGLNNSSKHLLVTSFKHSPFRTTVHTFISTNSQSFHHPFDLSHLKRFLFCLYQQHFWHSFCIYNWVRHFIMLISYVHNNFRNTECRE